MRPVVLGVAAEAGRVTLAVTRYVVETKGPGWNFFNKSEAVEKRIELLDLRRFDKPSAFIKWLDMQALDSRTTLGTGPIRMLVDASGLDGVGLVRALNSAWWHECRWKDRRSAGLVKIVPGDARPRRASGAVEIGRVHLAGLLAVRLEEDLKVVTKSLRSELASQLKSFREREERSAANPEDLVTALQLCVVEWEHLERSSETRVVPVDY